jgi:3-hydroxyisobutyrate dehydrogenase-like beta-hydroxyacid dehydrogenase
MKSLFGTGLPAKPTIWWLGGALLAKSPKDAAEQGEMIFGVTANDESSRQIWLSPDGILAGAKSG